MTQITLSIEGGERLADLIEFVQEGVGWRRFNQRRERLRKAVERRALKVLGTYPPPRSGLRKFRFATEKSRRWFFANIDAPYQRTGGLGKAWRVRQSITRAGFSFNVFNEADAAEFVYGGEQFRQVPGHFDTGWQNADTAFIELASDTETELVRELDALIAEAL